MTFLTAEDYASVIRQRIVAERLTLSTAWLARLRQLLTVAPNEVFPSEQLLDHIPLLVDQIAGYLSAPETEEIAANAATNRHDFLVALERALKTDIAEKRAAEEKAAEPDIPELRVLRPTA